MWHFVSYVGLFCVRILNIVVADILIPGPYTIVTSFVVLHFLLHFVRPENIPYFPYESIREGIHRVRIFSD